MGMIDSRLYVRVFVMHRQVPDGVGGGYCTCICHGGVSLSIKK